MSTSDFSTFALFTAGLAAFAPAVSALVVPGGSNPTAGAVTAPDATSSVTAGKSFKVQWNATDAAVALCGDKVDLVLLYGPSPASMAAQDYIVQGTANSGSYDWTPSTSLKASDDTNKYGIELVCESTKAYQYTTRFQIANENPTSSSASASSPAGGYTSSSASHSGASSATSASSSASSSESPKYPTGNSTTAAGTTGAASSTGAASTTGTATSSGHHASSTGSGSKTSGSGSSSSTASSTSSSASATSSGNAAEHLKAGFGGLLAAAVVAALAL